MWEILGQVALFVILAAAVLVAFAGVLLFVGWLVGLADVVSDDKNWPWWLKVLTYAGLFLAGCSPLAALILAGEPGMHGLREVGRFLLLLLVVPLIVAGYPVVWLTDWPKWRKVVVCVLLAVVSLGGRTLLGWYDLVP